MLLVSVIQLKTDHFSEWLTRLLDRRDHSLSQHTQFLKMRMIFYETLTHSIGPKRSHLVRFARARFALRAHENFRKKKCVSIDSKCSKTHRNAKKKFYLFDRLRASRVAQSPSGVAQWNFNTINRTYVPTFSPNFIKIQHIVIEI